RAADATQELRLVDDLYAQRLCLLEFAAGLRAGDDRVRLLAHAAGHPTTGRFDQLGGLAPRERGQRAGQHVGLALERAARLGGAWLAELEPGLLQPPHELQVARLGEEPDYRLRDGAAHSRH